MNNEEKEIDKTAVKASNEETAIQNEDQSRIEAINALQDDIIRNDTIPETSTNKPGSNGAFPVGAFDTSKEQRLLTSKSNFVKNLQVIYVFLLSLMFSTMCSVPVTTAGTLHFQTRKCSMAFPHCLVLQRKEFPERRSTISGFCSVMYKAFLSAFARWDPNTSKF